MSITITLVSVKCEATSGGSGADEVYVVYQPDAGIPIHIPRRFEEPQTMNVNDTWQINQEMTFNRDLLITLYDHDGAITDTFSDYLVSYDYTPNSLPSSVTISNNDGARYTLNITVSN